MRQLLPNSTDKYNIFTQIYILISTKKMVMECMLRPRSPKKSAITAVHYHCRWTCGV